MKNLTQKEMLELWKLGNFWLPLRTDCEVERSDGNDADGALLLQIDKWYSNLLETAPIHWLPTEDVKNELAVKQDSNSMVEVIMPDRCVRPVEWKLRAWDNSVTQFHLPDSYEAQLQRCHYLRGGKKNPVAVRVGQMLQLYSISPTDTTSIEKAICVARPKDGRYRFSEAALPIKPIVN